MTGAAINRDDIAFLQCGFTNSCVAQMIVNHNLLASRDTRFAHAARHNCGMRCLAATAGQNTLCLEETVYVLGLGFLANQNDFFAGAAARFGSIGIEHDLAGGRSGRSWQPLRQ